MYLKQNFAFEPEDPTNYTKVMGFQVEFGFTWGTPFEFTDKKLMIKAAEDQQCIVNIYASPWAILPKLKFLIFGAMDNLVLRDDTDVGVALDMSYGGLEIMGSKVFVTIGDHTISNLTVSLLYGTVLMREIRAPYKMINITEGIVKDIIPNDVVGTNVSLS